MFEPTGALKATRHGQVTVIAPIGTHTDALPGTNIILIGGDETRETLREWAQDQDVATIQKALGIGQGTAGRLRKALGLSETYDKNSRTTQWRHKK